MEMKWNEWQFEELNLPVTIFSSELGSLEAIVKYLKENMCMRFSAIAEILNRDARTIWGAYKSSTQKHPEPFAEINHPIAVPLGLIRNRNFGMLENLVWHLRENLGMRYSRIAALMRRDERTVWTAYMRAKRKWGYHGR